MTRENEPMPHRAVRSELQALLEARLGADRPSTASEGILISIRDKGGCPPLVCVLGGGAGLPTYRRLSAHLPELPMVALQLHRPENRESPFDTVEAMAEALLGPLRSHLATDRCYLCGHSMGATIAYELAQRLETTGTRVAGLFLIDQPGPAVDVTWRDWWYWQWAAIAHLPLRARYRYIWNGLMYRCRTARWAPSWLRRWLFSNRWSQPSSSREERLSANEYRRRMTDATIAALRAYRPRPSRFPCLLLRAQSGAPRIHADPHGGWGEVCGGRIRVVDVPGTHMDIFEEPRLPGIAALLESAIRGMERQRSSDGHGSDGDGEHVPPSAPRL